MDVPNGAKTNRVERYELNEQNKFVMEIKLHVCEILKKVLEISLDVRLSEFVNAFKNGGFTDTTVGGALQLLREGVIGGVNVIAKGITSTVQ